MRNTTLCSALLLGASLMSTAVAAETVQVEMTVEEKELAIDNAGTQRRMWTYGGTIPGPVVRVTQGDTVEFTLHNHPDNGNSHSMDFHAARVDVVGMHPGERYDVIVEMDNPGIWMTHDHVDNHVTSNGKEHGGSMMVVEYEGIEPVESYPWRGIDYEPDFYFSESLKQGPGLYSQEFRRGRDLMEF